MESTSRNVDHEHGDSSQLSSCGNTMSQNIDDGGATISDEKPPDRVITGSVSTPKSTNSLPLLHISPTITSPSSVGSTATSQSEALLSPVTPSGASTPSVVPPFSTPRSSGDSASSTSSFTSSQQLDFIHDLPGHLLKAGWRKYWSKREGRPYFFNKETSASLWELPGEHPPVTTNGCVAQKRRPSQDSTGSGIPTKKPNDVGDRNHHHHPTVGPEHVPGGLWNHRVASNAFCRKRSPCIFLPPNPYIELERGQILTKLRQQYNSICHARGGIVPAVGSFNRWNLQMKVDDRGFDPVLPSHSTNEVSDSMKRELLHSLPIPLNKPKFANEARQQLIKYAESAKTMMDTKNASPESRKIVKWNVDDIHQWLRSERHLTFDDLVERLAHLKRQCQPHIAEVSREDIVRICIKVYGISRDSAYQLRQCHVEWLTQIGTKMVEEKKMCEQPLLHHPSTDSSSSSPPILAHPSPLLCPCPLASGLVALNMYPVQIEQNSSGDLVAVDYKQTRFTLSKAHFDKLNCLYKKRADDDHNFQLFPQRLWCLLQRYHSYMGCENGDMDGLTNQAAVPISVFECLHRVFDVTFELFASPLNCYFPQYCSAFTDTDCYFGSCGPVLDFYPESGSFEANPPFCEEFLLAVVNHFEHLLESSSLPLSFVVFMPDWRDPPYEALTKLDSSKFKRIDVSLPPREHEYRLVNFPASSTQTCPEIIQRSNHATLMVFLQNEAGYTKWTPTPAKVNELVTAYNISTHKAY